MPDLVVGIGAEHVRVAAGHRMGSQLPVHPHTGVLIMATNLTAPPQHGGLIAAARH